MVENSEPSPTHVYLELSCIITNGAYFHVRADRIAASFSKAALFLTIGIEMNRTAPSFWPQQGMLMKAGRRKVRQAPVVNLGPCFSLPTTVSKRIS